MQSKSRMTSGKLVTAGVAEAVSGDAPLVLFYGGPFSEGDGAWGGTFTELLRRLSAHSGEEEDFADALFGSLGRAGFDPLKPGRVGLSTSAGLVLLPAGERIGLIAAVRSPKKWREFLQAALQGTLRPLKVSGAVEAGWGVVEEGWEVAFARRPPWLYALFGPEMSKTAAKTLADMMPAKGRESLAVRKAFRQAVGPGGVRGDLVLWIGDRVVSSLFAADGGDDWNAALGRWSETTGRAGRVLDAMFRLQGGALGLTVTRKALSVKGLVLAEGSWLDALDITVGKGSQCVIGPRALSRRCPVWAVSVLDWTLLARALPVVGQALDRVTGPLGDFLKRSSGGEERANGIAALGLCGVRADLLQEVSTARDELPPFVDAFLVLEVLGRNLPGQIAGRLLDAVGDVMRHGAKRLLKTEEEQVSSLLVGGFRIYMAMRRGAAILATSRDALSEARRMLEEGVPESLAPGYVLGGQVEMQGAIRMLVDAFAAGSGERVPGEILGEFRRWGAGRFQVERVPGGLRLLLDQTYHTRGP